MALPSRWLVPLVTLALGGLLSAPTMRGQTAPATGPRGREPADVPALRVALGKDGKDVWMPRHEQNVALAKQGRTDLYFLGDSITDGWRGRGRQVWEKEFAGWNPGNFGIGGDATQHVLWRLQNGELANLQPKVVVLLIGTNNTPGYTVEEIASGVAAVVQEIQKQSPGTKILLLGIFPRGDKPELPVRAKIKRVNALLAKLEAGPGVKYLDLEEKFLETDGTLSKEVMPDFLHLGEKGFQIWAEAIKPQLTAWLGEAAATAPAAK